MGRKVSMHYICNTCGNDMPKDKKRSTKDWPMYEKECKCGGKIKLNMVRVN